MVTSGHDVADARLHREVAGFLAAGLRVEVLGLGSPHDAPAGAAVRTWPRRHGAGRARLALIMARQASGQVLFSLDPDSALACAAVVATSSRPGRIRQRARQRTRRRLAVDVHEDYAALLQDRPWAQGAQGQLAQNLVRGFLSVAARADLTVVADDHVPPLQARNRVVVRNEPDLALLPAPQPPGPQRRLLYVGDVRESRGLFAMLAAVQQAPGWELDVVGPVASADGPRLDTILGDDPDLSARVRLHGRMPPGAAWELAAGAWAGLLLLSDTPAFRRAQPSKLGEYLACGLPVITTNLPRPAELIGSLGAGVVVAGGGAERVGAGVAQALRGWQDDPRSYRTARQAALSWAAEQRQRPGPYRQLGELVAGLGVTNVNLGTLLPEPVRDGLRTLRRVVPQPLVSLAERAASGSTDPLAGADGRPQPPRSDHRLWVGPVNYAGQGHQWARAIESHSAQVGARSMAVVRSLRFPVDYEVSPRAYGFIDWQRAQERYVMRHYTHVLIEAERPLFGTLYGGTCERELPRLRRAGLRPALICHGSDVRLPSRHAARFPFSPFADPTDQLTGRLQRQATRNLAILASVDEPVFVSTPDLLDDVPQARWCPVVVDPTRWATDRPVLERDRPVVVHIPTSGPLKGSGLVDPVLRELDERGYIEYRSLRGLSHQEVRQAYQDADIVLDQFVLGLYGVSAAEAMAAGRVVVAYVTDPVRRRVAEATGFDVPILEADPSTVREVVLRVIHDRQEGQRIAAQGPGFVRAVHDGRHSARVLSAIFDQPCAGLG